MALHTCLAQCWTTATSGGGGGGGGVGCRATRKKKFTTCTRNEAKIILYIVRPHTRKHTAYTTVRLFAPVMLCLHENCTIVSSHQRFRRFFLLTLFSRVALTVFWLCVRDWEWLLWGKCQVVNADNNEIFFLILFKREWCFTVGLALRFIFCVGFSVLGSKEFV